MATNAATGQVIHSVFDLDGKRIAEYDYDPLTGTSTLLREYIWLEGEPVAVVEGGQIYFVRSDHIGRPSFATDGMGAMVWSVSYLPFGEVRTSTGSPIDARFPGQWFQAESGLHQNWMRDYDPTTGRYIEPDPLGLVDGPSVYGYAGQNPGRWTDPRGECFGPLAYVCAVAGGAAVSVAIGIIVDATLGDGCYTAEEFWWDAGLGAAGGVLFKGVGAGWRAWQGAGAATARTTTADIAVSKGVQANKAAGDAFRDHIADLLRKAGRNVDTEVLVKTPFGRRIQDIEVSIGSRVVGYIETKTGSSRYLPSQRVKDFWIEIRYGLKTTVVRGP